MSSESDDDGSIDIKRSSRKGGENATQRITNLSDDSSDDGRLHDPITPVRSNHGKKRHRSEDDEDSSTDERPSKRTVVDAHERRVLKRKLSDISVDILHFPPTLPVPLTIAGKGTTKNTGAIPVSFRPLKNIRGNPSVALFRALERGPCALPDVLESNANLVTWPDGTRTLVVGDEQYTIVSDTLVSDFFIFRKGEDVQTFESRVKSVGRVQPCSLGGMRTQMALSKAGGSGRKEPRKIMLTMKEGGEHEEKLAKEASTRKERERMKQDAKRRSTIDRHHPRTSRQSSVQYDSEPEASDGEADRMAEQQRRHRYAELSVKNRKAGRRKVLGSDDESDSE